MIASVHELPAVQLPVVDPGQAPPERADAARNRARILAAAAELVAERGIERVSMDDVNRNTGSLEPNVNNSTYADAFAKAHPGRYFEMFLPEQQMVASRSTTTAP